MGILSCKPKGARFSGRSALSHPSDFFRHATEALEPDMDFNAFANRVKAASGATGKQLFQPLRAALTGQLQGPEMPRLFRLIGFERAKRRLSEHVLNIEID